MAKLGTNPLVIIDPSTGEITETGTGLKVEASSFKIEGLVDELTSTLLEDLANPINATTGVSDAAQYMVTDAAGLIDESFLQYNIDFGANVLSGIAPGVLGTDAANIDQVNASAAGLTPKEQVAAATTAALPSTAAVVYDNGTSGVGATLTRGENGALGSIDGVAVIASDRVLVKNQADATQNGIYDVTALGDGSNPWVLTRSSDFDSSPSTEVMNSTTTFVTAGTLNGTAIYIVSSVGTGSTPDDHHIMGTDDIDFSLFNAASALSAGTGINIASGVISLASPLSGLNDVTAAHADGNMLVSDSGNWIDATQAELIDGTYGAGATADDLTDVTAVHSDGSIFSSDTGAWVSNSISDLVSGTLGSGADLHHLVDVGNTVDPAGNANDILYSNGTTWEQTDLQSLASTELSVFDLSDVEAVTGVAPHDLLKWSGSQFEHVSFKDAMRFGTGFNDDDVRIDTADRTAAATNSSNAALASGSATGAGSTSGNVVLSSGNGDGGTGDLQMLTGVHLGATGSSGAITIASGTSVSGDSGDVQLLGGSAGSGTAGSVLISSGSGVIDGDIIATAIGTGTIELNVAAVNQILFKDTSEVATADTHVWTSTTTSGAGTWRPLSTVVPSGTLQNSYDASSPAKISMASNDLTIDNDDSSPTSSLVFEATTATGYFMSASTSDAGMLSLTSTNPAPFDPLILVSQFGAAPTIGTAAVTGATPSGGLNFSTGTNVGGAGGTGSVIINAGVATVGPRGNILMLAGGLTGNFDGAAGATITASSGPFFATGSSSTIETNEEFTTTVSSGDIILETGACDDAVSGSVLVSTGIPTTGGDSGLISLTTGTPASGVSGAVSIASGSNTSTAASGIVTIKSGSTVDGASGALTVTSGNTSTGSTGLSYFGSGNGSATGGTSGQASFRSGTAVGANTGKVNVSSGSTNGVGNTGNLELFTGNALGTGNSGDVRVDTGTAPGGSTGRFIAIARQFVGTFEDSSSTTTSTGNISLTASAGDLTLSASSGDIEFVDGNQGSIVADEYVWTGQNTSGKGLWKKLSDLPAISGSGVEYTSGEALTIGDAVYFSGNGAVSRLDIDTSNVLVGLAMSTVGSAAAVKILANDTSLDVSGASLGASLGDRVYWTWDGSTGGLSLTAPAATGTRVWELGMISDASAQTLHVQVRFVKVNP